MLPASGRHGNHVAGTLPIDIEHLTQSIVVGRAGCSESWGQTRYFDAAFFAVRTQGFEASQLVDPSQMRAHLFFREKDTHMKTDFHVERQRQDVDHVNDIIDGVPVELNCFFF